MKNTHTQHTKYMQENETKQQQKSKISEQAVCKKQLVGLRPGVAQLSLAPETEILRLRPLVCEQTCAQITM